MSLMAWPHGCPTHYKCDKSETTLAKHVIFPNEPSTDVDHVLNVVNVFLVDIKSRTLALGEQFKHFCNIF